MPDYTDFNRILNDAEFLRSKEKSGNLIKLLSPVFSTNADQITYTPASGKTFFHIKSKLYPLASITAPAAPGTATRRTDIAIMNDITQIDALSHYNLSWSGFAGGSSGGGMGTVAHQYESNIFDSLIGDGIKSFKLTSAATSGSYRVSMLGWIEDT